MPPSSYHRAPPRELTDQRLREEQHEERRQRVEQRRVRGRRELQAVEEETLVHRNADEGEEEKLLPRLAGREPLSGRANPPQHDRQQHRGASESQQPERQRRNLQDRK